MKKSWLPFFKILKNKKYFQEIDLHLHLLKQNTKENQFSPKIQYLFRIFSLISLKQIRVFVLGQDPYPNNEIADGICFSTSHKITPMSLKIIYSELKKDLGIEKNTNSLIPWVKQGVFLFNSRLIFYKDINQQKKWYKYWEKFTIDLINYIIKNNNNIFFLLLGNVAKKIFINSNFTNYQNAIFLSHPSPLSYKKSFSNSKIFLKITNFLNNNIYW